MKLSTLAELSKAEFEIAIKQLPDEVTAKLKLLETQYGMTTAEMKAKFRAGDLEDTPDIARWLILARCTERKKVG